MLLEMTEACGRYYSMLSALDGADMTCCLSVKFQNTCWSGPSNMFAASCFSVLRRYSEPISIKNNPVDLSSLNKSDQLEGLKRTSTLSFSRSFMFSFSWSDSSCF